MPDPPSPPQPPEPQTYRVITYPNYFLAVLDHGQAVRVVTLDSQPHDGLIMDLSAFGLTLWINDRMNHIRWERIDHIEWDQPE